MLRRRNDGNTFKIVSGRAFQIPGNLFNVATFLSCPNTKWYSSFFLLLMFLFISDNSLFPFLLLLLLDIHGSIRLPNRVNSVVRMIAVRRNRCFWLLLYCGGMEQCSFLVHLWKECYQKWGVIEKKSFWSWGLQVVLTLVLTQVIEVFGDKSKRV